MKIFPLACAFAFTLASPALAAKPSYRFTIIGDDTYFYLSFDLLVSPKTDPGANLYGFSVSDITVGTVPDSFTGDMFFYLNDPHTDFAFGGIEVDDPDGNALISSDGPTLYTLSGTKPTFKTGSFDLTDYYDRDQPMPNDLHHYTITIGAAADAPPPPPPPSVPEPASWALMLCGFGAVGGVMRARRRTAVSFG
jgi:hypothetical protein